MALTVDIEKKYKGFTLRAAFRAGDETMALLGASGSGKSMTLRCIAGIETPDRGRIELDGVTLFDSEKRINLAPQRRRVGMMFQHYALFPQMTVRQNVACGARGSLKGAEGKRAVEETMEAFDLQELADRHPSQLSGGQQQRVAIARTLVLNPDMILFDEPMSALDAEIKLALRQQLKEIQKKLKITMIYVTHDQEEAFALSDRIMVINDLRIVQLDTPYNLYHHPADPFVKRFVVDHLDRKVASIEQSIQESRA